MATSVAENVAKHLENTYQTAKPGGQPGNQSAAKHGLRMTVSALPSGCHFISQSCYQLRRHLESWCLERRGEIGLWESCCIQTAIRYEQVSQLCARWLREANGKLTHAERLGYAKQIAEASDRRDRVLQRLGLDKSDADGIFDALYATPQPTLPAPVGGNGETRHETADQTAPGAPGSAAGGGGGDTAGEPAGPSGGGLGDETA